MISIAVVTKRAGFTLTMHSRGHHFTEVRPTAGWLERRLSEDVLVLDLETAASAGEAVSTLRSTGTEQPIIVVANETDGWDSLIADHSDLFLVSLPVTQTSLLTTVDRAARLAHVVPAAATAFVPAEAEVIAAAGAPTAVEAGARGQGAGAGIAGDRVAVPRLQTRPRPTAPSTPSPAHATEATAPSAEAVQLADEPVQLVRELRPLVGRLSRVPDVAELLRQRCASAVPCEASAVLVPDGTFWRVAAGHRLRPLEERLQVDAEHWLVTEVVGHGHGVLIRDTDIVRTRLSGAPLAAWSNLMALPVTEADAVVLLARQIKAFSRPDLTSGQQAIGPVGLQLGAAVDVRDLARALAAFANPVE